MTMIAGAIGQVFYQKTCETKNTGELTDIVENLYMRLVAIGLFPMLLLCIVGKDLFIIALGSNWSEAGIYTQILAPWMFFTFISSPLSTLFASFERQGSALIVHSTIFFVRFSSLYIGCVLQNVYIGLGLFSITGVLVYAGLAIWNMRLANVPIHRFFTILAKSFFTFLPVGLAFFLVKYFLTAPSTIVLLLTLITLIVYYIIIIRNDPILSSYLDSIPFMKKSMQYD
jgi:O-antigen/teichoic acid export membrane protein